MKEAIKVFQPLLLWNIIHYFENYDPEDQKGLIMAYVYASALSLSAFGLTILQHLYYYTVLRLGMKIRVALCHMIYRKVGRLWQILWQSEWIALVIWAIFLCRLWLSALNPWVLQPPDRLSTSSQMMSIILMRYHDKVIVAIKSISQTDLFHASKVDFIYLFVYRSRWNCTICGLDHFKHWWSYFFFGTRLVYLVWRVWEPSSSCYLYRPGSESFLVSSGKW